MSKRPTEKTMASRLTLPRTTRRSLIQSVAAGLAGCGLVQPALAQVPPEESETVRDRFWIFTCAANSD